MKVLCFFFFFFGGGGTPRFPKVEAPNCKSAPREPDTHKLRDIKAPIT